MAEVLTSDLHHDGEVVAERGDKLPKSFNGDADALREMGVLRPEEEFRFEPEGGVKLPEGLGNSMSGNATKALEARLHAESEDPNQEKINEASASGELPESVMKDEGKDASGKKEEEIKASQRPESK